MVLSVLLVVVAAGTLAAGSLREVKELVYASIACSALSAVFFVAGLVRERRRARGARLLAEATEAALGRREAPVPAEASNSWASPVWEEDEAPAASAWETEDLAARDLGAGAEPDMTSVEDRFRELEVEIEEAEAEAEQEAAGVPDTAGGGWEEDEEEVAEAPPTRATLRLVPEEAAEEPEEAWAEEPWMDREPAAPPSPPEPAAVPAPYPKSPMPAPPVAKGVEPAPPVPVRAGRRPGGRPEAKAAAKAKPKAAAKAKPRAAAKAKPKSAAKAKPAAKAAKAAAKAKPKAAARAKPAAKAAKAAAKAKPKAAAKAKPAAKAAKPKPKSKATPRTVSREVTTHHVPGVGDVAVVSLDEEAE